MHARPLRRTLCPALCRVFGRGTGALLRAVCREDSSEGDWLPTWVFSSSSVEDARPETFSPAASKHMSGRFFPFQPHLSSPLPTLSLSVLLSYSCCLSCFCFPVSSESLPSAPPPPPDSPGPTLTTSAFYRIVGTFQTTAADDPTHQPDLPCWTRLLLSR